MNGWRGLRSSRWWIVAAVCWMLLGGGVFAQDGERRAFHLGFTPFPYAISFEAVDWTYATLAQDADLVAQHFDNGVPWVEALSGAPFNDALMQDWNDRKARTPDDAVLYLSITPINFWRTTIATYRGSAEDMPLPSPWDTYTFDSPDVLTAFVRYAERAVEFFQPDYLNIGVEANLLMRNAPDQWDSYIRMHRQVYTLLKQLYPDLTIFVSLTGIDMLEGYNDSNHADQMKALADIAPYTDLFAWSLYPYMTNYMTNSIPTDMFDRLADLVAPYGKPMAVSETGYPAQTFRVDVGGGTLVTFDGTPEKQAQYIDLLLNAAQEYRMPFVINFVLRDYDALWQQIGAKEDLTIAWRDTGLFDEDGAGRPALDLWRRWLALPMGGAG